VRKLNYCCGVKQARGFKWAWMYKFGTKRENYILLVVVSLVVATDVDKNVRFLKF